MRTVPELVFVNCCHLGAADAGELLKTYNRAEFASGVAGALIDIGVRCVVAAGWAVDDDAAQTFAQDVLRVAPLAASGSSTPWARRALAAYTLDPHGNTWAAYQCYGDPDWVFRHAPTDANRVATPSGDEFGGVASALSLQFTLERLIVGTRFQGVSPRLLLEKLKVLEKKTKATDSDWAVWANDGAVAELFGHAFVEADDVEAGIAWYERAIAAEDGTASIHAAEQLANGRSRMAWEIVDTALRLRGAGVAPDDVEERADASRRARAAAIRLSLRPSSARIS